MNSIYCMSLIDEREKNMIDTQKEMGIIAFCKFFQNIPEDLDVALGVVEEAVGSIAEEYHVGMYQMGIFCPQSELDSQGLNDTKVFYHSPKGYAADGISEEYVLSGRNKAFFNAYPETEYTWSEDEETILHFTFEQCAQFVSRVRMNSLLCNVEFTDSLTRIPNTPGLMRHITKLQTKNQFKNYAAVFFNIKGFIYINQQFSPRVGDIVLKRYGSILVSMNRDDEFVARLGGDNFFSLVEKSHLTEYLDTIKDIELSVNVGSMDHVFHIRVNAGVFLIESYHSFADVMNGSAVAMNMAKQSGRQNIIFFENFMQERIRFEKEVENSFPMALEQKRFIVYYQPKVNTDTMELVGCEALARWNNNNEIIPPSKFVPILERSGNISALDFYILNRVCEDIRGWLNRGLDPVRVSVNFSSHHIRDDNLAQEIMSIIEHNHIDPRYLEIELTETAWYEDMDALKRFVKILHEHSIKVSLDDFGTGYSSLNLLKDVPVDILKIDKSFVDNITDDTKYDSMVVEAIVHMAKKIGIEIIAEGVETKLQCEKLSELGCNLIQGFYFDKPMPHGVLTAKLSDKKLYMI